MMKIKTTYIGLAALLVTLAVVIFSLLALNYNKPNTAVSAQKESTFDRVKRTGELRVAYFIQPPYLNKDTATGRMSGVFYNFTEELGKRLGIKIRWVEELNLTNLAVGFDTGRYDMIAFTLWRSAARSKLVSFSVPLFYTAVGAYARADDTRFDRDIFLINSPDVTIAAVDGELAAKIAAEDFPKAQVIALPQIADYSQLLLQVASKKSDVTFFNRLYAQRYINRNPGTVREVSRTPIRVFAECFVLPLGDERFSSMINSSITELLDNGQFDTALRANGEDPSSYYRVATPYRAPQ